jgi:hypothetical protein
MQLLTKNSFGGTCARRERLPQRAGFTNSKELSIMTNQNNDKSGQQNPTGHKDQQKSGQQAGQQQGQHGQQGQDSKTKGSQDQSGESNRSSGASQGKSNPGNDHGNKR